MDELRAAASEAELAEPMLRWFEWSHLPDDLAAVSGRFGVMAGHLVAVLPRTPERTVALRKLLEAGVEMQRLHENADDATREWVIAQRVEMLQKMADSPEAATVVIPDNDDEEG